MDEAARVPHGEAAMTSPDPPSQYNNANIHKSSGQVDDEDNDRKTQLRARNRKAAAKFRVRKKHDVENLWKKESAAWDLIFRVGPGIEKEEVTVIEQPGLRDQHTASPPGPVNPEIRSSHMREGRRREGRRREGHRRRDCPDGTFAAGSAYFVRIDSAKVQYSNITSH
jgi:hypothetical protein